MPDLGGAALPLKIDNVGATTAAVGSLVANLKKIGLAAAGIYSVDKALKFTTNSALEFNEAMHDVWTLTDKTAGQLQRLSADVRTFARSFNISATQASKALYQIYSATFYGADAMKILDASTKGAAAGLADVYHAADMTTTILNAYRMSAEKATYVQDLLFAAPVGARLEEMTAALATLTRAGIQTDWAVTSLRQTLMQLLRPTRTLKESIQSMGYASGAALVKAVGFAEALKLIAKYAEENNIGMEQMFTNVRAVTGVLPLTTTLAGEYVKDLERMATASGMMSIAFQKQAEAWTYQLAKAKTAIQDTAISIGDALAPALVALYKTLNVILSPLKIFFEIFNKMGGDYFIAITAVIGGLTAAVTALGWAWKKVTAWAAAATASLSTAATAATAATTQISAASAAMLGTNIQMGFAPAAAVAAGTSGGILSRLVKLGGGSLLAGLARAAGGGLAASFALKSVLNLRLEFGAVEGIESVKRALKSAAGSIIGGAIAGWLFGGPVGAAIGAMLGIAAITINVIHQIRIGLTEPLPTPPGYELTPEGWLLPERPAATEPGVSVAGANIANKLAQQFASSVTKAYAAMGPDAAGAFAKAINAALEEALTEITGDIEGVRKAARAAFLAELPNDLADAFRKLWGMAVKTVAEFPSGFHLRPADVGYVKRPLPSPSALTADWSSAQLAWAELTATLRDNTATAEDITKAYQDMGSMADMWETIAEAIAGTMPVLSAIITETVSKWRKQMGDDSAETLDIVTKSANDFRNNLAVLRVAFTEAEAGSLEQAIALQGLRQALGQAKDYVASLTDEEIAANPELLNLISSIEDLGITADTAKSAIERFNDALSAVSLSNLAAGIESAFQNLEAEFLSADTLGKMANALSGLISGPQALDYNKPYCLKGDETIRQAIT